VPAGEWENGHAGAYYGEKGETRGRKGRKKNMEKVQELGYSAIKRRKKRKTVKNSGATQVGSFK